MSSPLFLLYRPDPSKESGRTDIHVFRRVADAHRFATVQEMKDPQVREVMDLTDGGSDDHVVAIRHDTTTGKLQVFSNYQPQENTRLLDPYLNLTASNKALWHVAFTSKGEVLKMAKVYRDRDCTNPRVLPRADGFDPGYFDEPKGNYKYHPFAMDEEELQPLITSRIRAIFGKEGERTFRTMTEVAFRETFSKGDVITFIQPLVDEGGIIVAAEHKYVIPTRDIRSKSGPEVIALFEALVRNDRKEMEAK